jgi:hypothetical protein
MYLCENSLERFSNIGNCLLGDFFYQNLLGDLIALVIKKSIAFSIIIVHNRVIIASAI